MGIKGDEEEEETTGCVSSSSNLNGDFEPAAFIVCLGFTSLLHSVSIPLPSCHASHAAHATLPPTPVKPHKQRKDNAGSVRQG